MRKFVFTLLLLIPLTACTAASSPPASEANPQTETVSLPTTTTATPVTPVADLVQSTTYVDPNLVYAFDYPSDGP